MANLRKMISIIPPNPLYNANAIRNVKKLRVAAYCRVSTEMEEQQSSYHAQVSHYTAEIMNNPDFLFAGVYADEGISGTNTTKRTEFNRMIADCMSDKIDMVITKSISRFARNTVDCISNIRLLKEKNIGVLFEKENINTLDGAGELLITILGSLAQEESRSISTNTRWGIAHRFQEGKLHVNHNRFMGFTKNEKGDLIIVPEQAQIVKRIFRLYLEGKSILQIKRTLENEKTITCTGKTVWQETVISKMLKNEKYMGDALLQKTYTIDFLTKKRADNKGVVPQYYIEDNHEAIIPKTLFVRAQEEMARRSNIKKISDSKKKGVYNSKYALSEKMICYECGQPYKRITWPGEKKPIVWRCVSRIKDGKRVCQHSPSLHEDRLHGAIMETINAAIHNKEKLLKKIKENIMSVINASSDIPALDIIDNEISLKEKEMMALASINADKGADSDEFDEGYKVIAEEIKRLKTLKKATATSATTIEDAATKAIDIKNATKTRKQEGLAARIIDMNHLLTQQNCEIIQFDEDIVRRLIDKIHVVSKGKIIVQFKSGIVIEQDIRSNKN